MSALFGATVSGAATAATQGLPGVVAGTQPGDGGFFDTLGAVTSRALETALDFGTGLLQIDLFNRANTTGTENTNAATNTGNQQSAGSTGGSSGGFTLPGNTGTYLIIAAVVFGAILIAKA